MGGGLGTRGVRSAAISSAALLFVILLFTFRTKVQLFSAMRACFYPSLRGTDPKHEYAPSRRRTRGSTSLTST